MKKTLVVLLAILSGVCFGTALSTQLLISGSLGQTYRAYIVQSGSMEPALPVGSIVFTRTNSNYAKGEIITFKTNNSDTLVTHRIVDTVTENGEEFYLTKGDANEEVDSGKVAMNQVIGRSFLSVPGFGYFADFVRTPKGFVIFVIIPASIIIYEELKAVIRELKGVLFKNKETTGGAAKAAIFIPIFGSLLLFLSSTGSFFNDNESSSTNVLSAASSYEATPTPTPTPTSSPIPTP